MRKQYSTDVQVIQNSSLLKAVLCASRCFFTRSWLRAWNRVLQDLGLQPVSLCGPPSIGVNTHQQPSHLDKPCFLNHLNGIVQKCRIPSIIIIFDHEDHGSPLGSLNLSCLLLRNILPSAPLSGPVPAGTGACAASASQLMLRLGVSCNEAAGQMHQLLGISTGCCKLMTCVGLLSFWLTNLSGL